MQRSNVGKGAKASCPAQLVGVRVCCLCPFIHRRRAIPGFAQEVTRVNYILLPVFSCKA